MAFPLTQAPVTVEIAPGADPEDQDTWSFIDITSDVRTEDGIEIGYGRRDEGSKVDPASCSLTLDNSSGDYSPRNAEGPYFGRLARNTPLRVRWLVDNDDFSTTSSNAWGAADSGIDWHEWGAGGSILSSQFQVTGGEASHLLPTSAAYRVSSLDEVHALDVDIKTTVRMSITDVTGGTARAGIILRMQDISNYYRCEMEVGTDESVTARIVRVTAGTDVVFSTAVVSGLTYTSSKTFGIRAHMVGPRLRVKVWDVAGAEPAAWTAEGISTNITTPGGIGLRSGVGAGNTNLPFTVFYKDFVANTDRFVGFVSEWPPRWDKSLNDQTVTVEAAGILRRLQQRNKPVESTLRKRIPSFNPKAYWPLEDGLGTTKAGSAVVGGSAMTVAGFEFESDDSLPGSKALPTIGPGSSYRGVVRPWSGSTEWQVEFVIKMDTPTGSNRLMFVNTNGKCRRFEVSVTPTLVVVTGYDEDDAQLFTQSGTADSFFGVWSRLALRATTTAGTTTWDVRWFPIGSGGFHFGNTFSGSCGAVTSVALSQRGSGANDVTIGHISVVDEYDGLAYAFADSGFANDHASWRLERLLIDEGILFLNFSNGDETARVGPQTVATLVDLMDEVEVTDGGILYELDGGLAYLPKSAIYNQPVALALSIVGGDIGEVPEPTDDDQILINDVTVTRSGGSMSRQVDVASVAREGTYNTEITANVASDDQLDDLAGWNLHLGTVDEMRWPRVTLNLASTPELIQQWQAMRIASRFTIAQDLLPGVSVDLLAMGRTETITPYGYTVEINAVPAAPWNVGVLDDDVLGKLDTDGSTLNSAATSTATSISVKRTDAKTPLWTTSAGEFPFDIKVGGEIMTVTNITGASSPQTFTVTRSVNGVVKAQTAGTDVNLAQPLVLAL